MQEVWRASSRRTSFTWRVVGPPVFMEVRVLRKHRSGSVPQKGPQRARLLRNHRTRVLIGEWGRAAKTGVAEAALDAVRIGRCTSTAGAARARPRARLA